MTLRSEQADPAILSALGQLSAAWRWGAVPKLLTLTRQAGRPAVPYTLAGALDGQTASDLVQHWIGQCRIHRGIIEVQRDLGVDAIGVSFEDSERHFVYAMDRTGMEYLAVGHRSSPEPQLSAGADLAKTPYLDDLADQLAELVWRLAGPPVPSTGARIRDMWPVAGLVDLDEDELHERYAWSGHTEPDIRLVVVASIDGLAAVEGASGTLTSPGDQRVYQLIKRDADLLLLGAGTARAESYGPTLLSAPEVARRRSNGLQPYPTIAVITRSLDLDPTGPLFQQHAGRHVPPRPILITPATAVPTGNPEIAKHADILVCGDLDVDLRHTIQQLHALGHSRIVCEGGASIAGQMARAGLLNEVCMTIAPQLLAVSGPRITAGPEALPASGDWRLTRSLLDEQGNLFLRYARLTGPLNRAE
ncbi:dihydrofolate reductase family protein [Micromonospora sp. CA-263727]|uniref:dihydrofolate reductase family protein n=1 Tax=Micromonospora sp. CA-263727 TaxID=3239967 RepID=UPI003D8FE23B